MTPENSELLALAQKRNASIPDIIRNDEVLRKRREYRTMFLRVVSKYFLRKGSTLEGQENLESALKTGQAGTPLIVISNHFSDADHSIKRFMLEQNGYREFADRLLYLAGLKMIERPLVRQVASAESLVLIPTPFDLEKLRTAIKSTEFTAEQRWILQRLKANYTDLSHETKRKVDEAQKTDDSILSFYPESTRSRTGQAISAHNLTNIWYQYNPDALIVPISIEGGEYMQPPGTILPYRRINARVRVGQPIQVQDVLTKAQELPRRDRAQFVADYPFSFVVNSLDPKHVTPKLRSYYKELAAI